ncbi:MAG: energy transducer TonB [Marinilabiliaceae bacterium]|nr:energy transducer TonB [Marinilabiliaceae bacterium]
MKNNELLRIKFPTIKILAILSITISFSSNILANEKLTMILSVAVNDSVPTGISDSDKGTKKIDSDEQDIIKVSDKKYNCEELEESALLFAEEMPEFQGGITELTKFLSSQTRYPLEAEIDGIQGKVHVRFIVTEEGKLCNIRTYRGVHPLLDQEAERVIKRTNGKWNPGFHEGNPVNVVMIIPINFVLETKENYKKLLLATPLDENEQPAEFEGGEKKLLRFITKKIGYPPLAYRAKIEGRVWIQFCVAHDGSLQEIKAVRSPHPLLSDEAIRVIKLTEGKWKPGTKDGNAVNTIVTIPLNFNLGE